MSILIFRFLTRQSYRLHRIKEATFICSKPYASHIVSDLSDAGYKKVKEREYVEGGKFKIFEKTYHRIVGNNTNIAIIKFGQDGSAQVTFKIQ